MFTLIWLLLVRSVLCEQLAFETWQTGQVVPADSSQGFGFESGSQWYDFLNFFGDALDWFYIQTQEKKKSWILTNALCVCFTCFYDCTTWILIFLYSLLCPIIYSSHPLFSYCRTCGGISSIHIVSSAQGGGCLHADCNFGNLTLEGAVAELSDQGTAT